MAGILTLDTGSFETEEQVIRVWLLDVCSEYGGTFTRHGQLPDVQGGKLSYDPYEKSVETVVAAEEHQLGELLAQDLITDWYIEHPPERPRDTNQTSDARAFVQRLNELSAALSEQIFDEFDEIPAPIDEFSEAETRGPPVGQYMLVHFLSNKHGYDSFEEADMYVTLLNTCLYNIARGFGLEEMHEKTAEAVSRIERTPAQIEAFHEQMAGQQKFDVELDQNNEYPE